MPENIDLKFEILDLVEEISAEDIADILTGTAEALKNIGDEQDDTVNNNWKIVNISMHSPLQVLYVPEDKTRKEIAHETRKEFYAILEFIEENREIPPGCTQKTIECIYKVILAIKRIRIAKNIRYDSRDIGTMVITPKFDEHIEYIVQLFKKEAYTEWTTLIGKLSEVGGKGPTGDESPYFNLYSKLFQKRVRCYFADEDFDKFHDYLQLNPIEVSIFGKVKFNIKGIPLSVTEITNHKILTPHEELSKTSEKCNIDITGGMNTLDYLHRVRYGEG